MLPYMKFGLRLRFPSAFLRNCNGKVFYENYAQEIFERANAAA